MLLAATHSFECLQGVVETYTILVRELLNLVHQPFESALLISLSRYDPFVRLVTTLASTLVKKNIFNFVILILKCNFHCF